MDQTLDSSELYGAEVQRLLASRTLQNAESLKRLLEYLARQSLEGQAETLKEYTVGTEAFGKPEDYDPKSDSSVRVQVSKLRQKLDEYYRNEGSKDPVLVELPKGHFKLVFRRMDEAGAPPGQPGPAAAARKWRWISLLLAAALVITAGLALRSRVSPGSAGDQAWLKQHWTPELQVLWQPYLQSTRPIMVCMGAPLFVKVGNAFFRDPTLNDWEHARDSGAVRLLQRELKSEAALPSFNYTAAGEARGVFDLARLFASQRRDLLLQSSDTLSWEDISRNNMIFVGPGKYNAQIRDLPVQAHFAIERHEIQNLRPQEGEVLAFPEIWAADHSELIEGYALISRLPGLHGVGEITVLAATSTEGTRAAVEYATKPEYAQQMVAKLRGSSGSLPRYFQVVVRAKFKSHVPLEITYVTHRVL